MESYSFPSSQLLISTYETPLGRLRLEANCHGLVRACPDEADPRHPSHEEMVIQAQAAAHLEQTERWLDAYFDHRPLPDKPVMKPAGSFFQQAVWQALMRLPYGCTFTYGEVARLVGRSYGAQAVGQAVGANPILILIPCHRIVASEDIGGYVWGTDRKRWLLEWEKRGLLMQYRDVLK